MNARYWPPATILLGLIAIGTVVAFSYLPEVIAAYPGGDFATELGRFQRASTTADLASVFGEPANPAKLAAMQAGNTLDLYGFIPAYTAFLIAAAGMLAGGQRSKLVWLAIVPILIGAGGDVLETSKQLAITADYANANAALPVAPYCWIKYFGLGFGALGMSAICFLGLSKRVILGALGTLPLITAIVAFLNLVQIPSLMAVGSGAFWVALVIVGFMEMLRTPPVAA